VGLRRSPALPVVAELRVEGAQPGLDLYVRLIGEDLVLAGFGCVESLRDEQGRVELSGSAVCAAVAVSTQPTCTPTTWTPAGASSSRRTVRVPD
jgi:hypothetical protein